MIAIAKPYCPKPGTKVLFIGGPWDGREMEFDWVEPCYQVANYQAPRFALDEPPDPRETIDIVEYRAYRFRAGENDPEFVFYAAKPLTPVHVMQRLWAMYRKDAVGAV